MIQGVSKEAGVGVGVGGFWVRSYASFGFRV